MPTTQGRNSQNPSASEGSLRRVLQPAFLDMERSLFIRMDFPITDDLHAVAAFEHGPGGPGRPISVTDYEFRCDRNQGLSKPLRAGTPQGGRQMPGLNSSKGAHVKAGRGSKDRFPSGAAHCLEKPMDPFPIRMIRIPVGPLLIQPRTVRKGHTLKQAVDRRIGSHPGPHIALKSRWTLS